MDYLVQSVTDHHLPSYDEHIDIHSLPPLYIKRSNHKGGYTASFTLPDASQTDDVLILVSEEARLKKYTIRSKRGVFADSIFKLPKKGLVGTIQACCNHPHVKIIIQKEKDVKSLKQVSFLTRISSMYKSLIK